MAGGARHPGTGHVMCWQRKRICSRTACVESAHCSAQGVVGCTPPTQQCSQLILLHCADSEVQLPLPSRNGIIWKKNDLPANSQIKKSRSLPSYTNKCLCPRAHISAYTVNWLVAIRGLDTPRGKLIAASDCIRCSCVSVIVKYWVTLCNNRSSGLR